MVSCFLQNNRLLILLLLLLIHNDLVNKNMVDTHTNTHTVFLLVLGGSLIPFLPPSVPRVSKSFGKRVVVNLQLRYLSKTQRDRIHFRVYGSRIKNVSSTLLEGIVFIWPTFVFGLTHRETNVLDRSHGRPRIYIINKSVMTGLYSHRPLERNSATKYSSMGPHKPLLPRNKGRGSNAWTDDYHINI